MVAVNFQNAQQYIVEITSCYILCISVCSMELRHSKEYCSKQATAADVTAFHFYIDFSIGSLLSVLNVKF